MGNSNWIRISPSAGKGRNVAAGESLLVGNREKESSLCTEHTDRAQAHGVGEERVCEGVPLRLSHSTACGQGRMGRETAPGPGTVQE